MFSNFMNKSKKFFNDSKKAMSEATSTIYE